MILKLNSLVKMAVAFPNYGNAILITIAVMIPMNLRICADRGIVQTDGRDVQVAPITDVFPNGYSAMGKTIAEITAMRNQKIVLSALKLISVVETIGVFQSK